jgi:glycyl-tRNA synthetase beta subunit
MMLKSRLKHYLAAPYGDMMLTGCFGVLAAMADTIPTLQGAIHAGLHGTGSEITPWDVDN